MSTKKARVNRKDSGSYQVSYSLGYNYAKRKYETFTRVCSTEAEAHFIARQIEEYIYFGGSTDKIRFRFSRKSPSTFREYSAQWLKKRKSQGRKGAVGKKLEARTVSENILHVNRMTAIIGDVPMNKLTSEVIALMFFRLECGDKDNLPCGGTYRQHIYTTLDLILKDAIKNDFIRGNSPLLGVDRPERDTAEKASLTVEETRACIKAIKAMPHLNAKAFGVLLCLTCGLRPSEMLALTWDDIHIDSASPYIRVWRSAVKDKQKRKSTKTNHERMVPVLPDMISIFEEWASQQALLLGEIGLKTNGETPVVNNRTGGMVIESCFRKWLHKNALPLALPEWITPYHLRHTFVTLGCVTCNINLKIIGSMVGHSYVTTTETYIHRLERDVCEAAQVISGVMFGGPDNTCKGCMHWSPSPLPSIGACWARGMKDIAVTLSDDVCFCGMMKHKHNLSFDFTNS